MGYAVGCAIQAWTSGEACGGLPPNNSNGDRDFSIQLSWNFAVTNIKLLVLPPTCR